MPEYNGFNTGKNLRGDYTGSLFFNFYLGVARAYKSIDLPPTPRQQQSGDFANARLSGIRATFAVGATSISTYFKGIAERVGALFVVRAEGKHTQRLSCYKSTDRLALVARLKTVDRIPLAKMISVFIGVNYKEVVMSNERGVAYGYLLPDNYYNTLIISPNGVVYQEISRSIDEVGTYDIICGRITKANVPTRQPHRKFV